MAKILFYATLMLATSLTFAQPGSPFFTIPTPTDHQAVIITSEPMINAGAANNPNVERKVVIAESFFRRLWFGVSSQDEMRRHRTYSRFNLNDQQASVMKQSISDWLLKTSADASSRQEQMCSYWNSQPGKADSVA